jgi:hypothetical protein
MIYAVCTFAILFIVLWCFRLDALQARLLFPLLSGDQHCSRQPCVREGLPNLHQGSRRKRDSMTGSRVNTLTGVVWLAALVFSFASIPRPWGIIVGTLLLVAVVVTAAASYREWIRSRRKR